MLCSICGRKVKIRQIIKSHRFIFPTRACCTDTSDNSAFLIARGTFFFVFLFFLFFFPMPGPAFTERSYNTRSCLSYLGEKAGSGDLERKERHTVIPQQFTGCNSQCMRTHQNNDHLHSPKMGRNYAHNSSFHSRRMRTNQNYDHLHAPKKWGT